MKKQTIALFLLTSMLALTLSACGGKNNNTSSNSPATPASASETASQKPAQAPVKLVVWDWLNGDQNSGSGKFFKDIDAAFQQAYPYITLEHVPQPSDKYYDLLQVAMSAGEAPDVFLMHVGKYKDFQKSLLKLNDSVADVRDQLIGWEGQSDGGDPEKGIYGIPMGIQGTVWYYNKDLFAKAGLDPENPPKTWDELLADSEKLKQANIIPIFGGNKEGAFFAAWVLESLYANLMSEDDMLKFGQEGVDYSKDAKIQTSWKLIKELIDKGYYPKEGLTTPIYPDGGEKFIKGEAAMTVGLIADVLNWKEFGEKLGYDKLGMFPSPAPAGSAFPNVVNASPGVAWSVSASSKAQEAALLYAKFVTNAENEVKFYQDAGTLPNNKTVDLSILDKDIVKAISESVFNTPTLPYAKYKSLMQANMGPPLQKYVLGGATLEGALKELQDAYEKDLALKK